VHNLEISCPCFLHLESRYIFLLPCTQDDVAFGGAGTGCTGAASLDDITDGQWETIRDKGPNKKTDRQKWKISQHLVDCAKAAGFNSDTRKELAPMSKASSILQSFTQRNSGAGETFPHDSEVTSPVMPLASKSRVTTVGKLSSDTEDDSGSQVQPIRFILLVFPLCVLVCLYQGVFWLLLVFVLTA
jgi:hypothetical protein